MISKVFEKMMATISLTGLFFWAVLMLPSSAPGSSGSNVINQIKVEKAKNETNIIIEGSYSSYRAFTLKKPARLVIDFEGTALGEEVPTSYEVDGPVISKIRVGRGDNRIRIVVESAEKTEPFHYNIGKKEQVVQIRCWRPGRAGMETARAGESEPGKDRARATVFPQKELSDILGITKEGKEEKEEAKSLPKYVGVKIQTIDFFQEDLHNVFRLFGEITGKNFIVDDSVKGTLTLSLRDVPWDLAMDIIGDMKNLTQEERNGILVIKPKGPARTEGELVVKAFTEKDLYPARIKQKEQQEEQAARALILRAHNLEMEGKREEALGIYEEAFNLSRENAELVKKTAYLHYSLEHYARSYFFAKEALKLNTQDAESALYAALSASQMGKDGEAKLFFEAATHSKPELPEAFYNYGLFLEKHGKYSNAIYVYQRYEEIFGPSLDVSLALARVYEADQRNSEACKRYREISFSGFTTDEATEKMIGQKIKSLCGQGG